MTIENVRRISKLELLLPAFEGPEKKLEMILFSPQPGLRSDENGRWQGVVRASGAEIISKISGTDMDAYLLSESSLFVREDRILMITCGRTTLVQALPEILRTVDKNNVAFLFYEQKNFMFPKEQPSDFENDVALITASFPGKHYKLGPANYDHVNVFYSSHAKARPEADVTLQILMHNLEADAMQLFCKNGNMTADAMLRESGIHRIYRRPMQTDGYLFSPCGYSMNGIDGNDYFTVHVTPHLSSSYVSFESNIKETDYSPTIEKVIAIFRPGRFSLVLTSSMDEDCLHSHETLENAVHGYALTDKSLYEFDCGYAVTFLNYIR